jgi:hypothetical protein
MNDTVYPQYPVPQQTFVPSGNYSGLNMASLSSYGAPVAAPAPTMDMGQVFGPSASQGYGTMSAWGQQPTAPTPKDSFWGEGGFNIGSMGQIVQGIGALGSAYLGIKNYGLAKDQLKFSKEAFNANLNNSIRAYNNSLEDRIRGRSSDHAGKEGEVQAYLASHSMKR